MDPQDDLEVHRSHNYTLAGIDPLLSLEEVHDIINHKIDITTKDTNVGSGAPPPSGSDETKAVIK